MPVALAMMVVGFSGTIAINGLPAAMSTLGGEAFEISTTETLIVVPLFILMGNLAGVSGISKDLYAAAYAWLGHYRGGLASATIGGCAGFAALSGSSIASAVTMGRVALPEMKRYKYGDSLATGAVAAGGIGILIPPSTGMIIYAILTEGVHWSAIHGGRISGLLMTALFILAIYIVTTLRPEMGPKAAKAPFRVRMASLGRAFVMIGIVLITIGGIFMGIFTPVEASGVGASLTMIVALAKGTLDWRSFRWVILQTMGTSATVFMILIGAFVLHSILALTNTGKPCKLFDQFRCRTLWHPNHNSGDLYIFGHFLRGSRHACANFAHHPACNLGAWV